MNLSHPQYKRSKTHQRLKVIAASLSIIILVGVITPPTSHATLPVIDPAAIAQMIQQYSELVRQLEAMYQQVELLQEQIRNATGHYGHGALGGVVDDWSGTSWQDISDMVGNGINPGDAEQVRNYKTARDDYKARFPVLDPSLQTTNPRTNEVYNAAYGGAIAGMSLAESSFNQVDTYLDKLKGLADRVDETDNVKSALDLNAAINVKVAQINAQIMRMQAAQLSLQAANQNAANNGYAAQTEFFAN